MPALSRRVLNATAFFWALLALPGVFMTYRYVQGTTFYGEYLHATGELGARLLILAMAVTPLRLMFPNAPWVRWLARRRRYIGVAAFGYSLLHAIAYLQRRETLTAIVEDATELALGTGWIALLVMLALAMTSNDASARLMRSRWKLLHRSVYVAAGLSFVHWIFSAFDPIPGAIHLAVLVALEAIRLWKTYGYRVRMT
jgi:sulfoxide reductase heme-binding subunit YedZ